MGLPCHVRCYRLATSRQDFVWSLRRSAASHSGTYWQGFCLQTRPRISMEAAAIPREGRGAASPMSYHGPRSTMLAPWTGSASSRAVTTALFRQYVPQWLSRGQRNRHGRRHVSTDGQVCTPSLAQDHSREATRAYRASTAQRLGGCVITDCTKTTDVVTCGFDVGSDRQCRVRQAIRPSAVVAAAFCA